MTSPSQPLSYPKYRPDIDGLRAIAVIAVVAFHAFPEWVKGGFIGVDIFFVISGYLITTIILENLEKGTFSFKEFYARRIKRIFPALICVLVACFVFGWFALLGDELIQLSKHIAAGAGFMSNLLLLREAGYFDNSADTKPLLHLWSLSIEEQFYIFWPLLLWFSWKRKLNIFIIIVLFASISFFFNIKGVEQYPTTTFYSPHTCFWELLAGSLLAWLSVYKNENFSKFTQRLDKFFNFIFYSSKRHSDGKTLSNIFSFAGFMFLAYGFTHINSDMPFPGNWALIPVAGAMLIIFAGAQAWSNRIVLSNKVAIWFGLISFPLYLWHWPILSFIRIVKSGSPSIDARIIAIPVSVLLAWLTVKVIEKPFRFGKYKNKVTLAILCGLIIATGVSALFVSKAALAQSHGYEKSTIKRRDFEHAFGASETWFRGKGDWLFLGNAHGKLVEKLQLAVVPTGSDIATIKESFSSIATVSAQYNIKTVLLVGPDKSSIYPEYLPDELVPSKKRYISFFLDELKTIPNLTIYDPTNDLLNAKKSAGLVYWMTESHWNNKGAFLAYSGFSKLFNLPTPGVNFQYKSTYAGDLIGLSNLKNFPLHKEDNWEVIWKNKPQLNKYKIPNEHESAFGTAEIIYNHKPLSDKYIWVVGDSFAGSLKQYFNATFKEIYYIGHWSEKLKDLPTNLAKADRKPDMIVIVKVERSF